MQLPNIALDRYQRTGPEQRQRIADELDLSCRNTGFFQITGHGVPASLTARTASIARSFFALPSDDKLRVEQPTTRTIRGFIPQGRAALSYTRSNESAPDYKESFSVGPLCNHASGTKHFEPNQWPLRPRGFQTTLSDYYRAVEALSERLLELMAHALDVPSKLLTGAAREHVSVLGLAYYPAQVEAPVAGQLRCGAHSDFGTLTILWPEHGSFGLQVHDQGGGWRSVSVTEGALVVNIGDVLEAWTGGRWRSTLHRVSNPPPGDNQSDRLSLGYFQHPNPAASMACLEKFESQRTKSLPEEMSFGDYLEAKFTSQVRS